MDFVVMGYALRHLERLDPFSPNSRACCAPADGC
jgi:hypothetical protein